MSYLRDAYFFDLKVKILNKAELIRLKQSLMSTAELRLILIPVQKQSRLS